jgi:hypothetical protein
LEWFGVPNQGLGLLAVKENIWNLNRLESIEVQGLDLFTIRRENVEEL